jgi:general secretion pathway protein D
MRFLMLPALLAILTAPLFADAPATITSASTACKGKAECAAQKKELKRAAQAFDRGVAFSREKRNAEAFDSFEEAAKLAPKNIQYVTAREITRQQLVSDHVRQGNELLLKSKQVEALAEFRTALELDPTNEFAVERLRDSLGEQAPKPSPALRLVAQSDEVQLKPNPANADLHDRGDARGLYQMIARAFGVTVQFDESVRSRYARIDVQNVDFFKAAQLADQLTHNFWAPVSDKQFIVAADSAENHRQYDRISVRTYYVTDETEPAAINDLVSTLRGVFDLKMITPEPAKSAIIVRGPTNTVEAATRFIKFVQGGPPQVMLDIQAFEVNRTFIQALGMELPLQFTMFNLPSAAALLLANRPDLQTAINQLIASGGLNQNNQAAIQALLAQLQQGQLPTNLTQPFATFGGGNTRFGVGIPPMTAHFHLNESSLASLEHVTVRAMQNKDSTFRVGSRYPILNASFSPLLNSSALSKVVGNGSFQSAFPSFSYEDIGLSVKAKPVIHASSDITLNLETSIRTLTGQTFNSVPVIASRDYKGTITVKDGEGAVVAGMITVQEQKSLSGLPGFSHIHGFGLLTSTNNVDNEYAEILVVITPHIISPGRNDTNEVYLGAVK